MEKTESQPIDDVGGLSVVSDSRLDNRLKAKEAIRIWLLFFAATLMMNLIIPLVLRIDLYNWTYSNAKGLLLFSVNYAGFFLFLPLVTTKGWMIVRKRSFIIPLIPAALSVVLWYPFHYVATIALVVYLYLHRKV